MTLSYDNTTGFRQKSTTTTTTKTNAQRRHDTTRHDQEPDGRQGDGPREVLLPLPVRRRELRDRLRPRQGEGRPVGGALMDVRGRAPQQGGRGGGTAGRGPGNRGGPLAGVRAELLLQVQTHTSIRAKCLCQCFIFCVRVYDIIRFVKCVLCVSVVSLVCVLFVSRVCVVCMFVGREKNKINSFFTYLTLVRYDYEGVASEGAEAMMESLRAGPAQPGDDLGSGFELKGDSYEYGKGQKRGTSQQQI